MPCQCISSKRCSNMTPLILGMTSFYWVLKRGTRGLYFILADFFVRRQASSNIIIIIIEGFGHQCGAGSAIFSQVEDLAAASPTTAWAPRNLGITPALSVFWNFHVVCFHDFTWNSDVLYRFPWQEEHFSGVMFRHGRKNVKRKYRKAYSSQGTSIKNSKCINEISANYWK